MKALVYTAPNEVVYRDEPDAAHAPGEVLIRVEAVGICGSDMHAYHGHDPRRKPPLILGHELAGTIVEGPGAGQRVTVNPLITCGACDYCRQGRDNLCANRTMIGMTRPGGFAEFVSTAAASVIDVPPGMDARQAALTEPAATALHAIHLAARALVRPLAEGCVLILGGGAIGMLATLLLAHRGVRDISVGEVNALRRRSLADATHARVYDPSTMSPDANAFDLVVDAVGGAATRTAAIAAVKPGGVVMHIGLADRASEIDMRKLTLAEITLIGTYTYTTADLRAAVRALHDGAFGDLTWVEERRLADGAAAFRDLHEGRAGAAKIVLRP
ncbi:MAG TPA: alcohol dehydrogenase catalytic domain-containing protein [Casimicrobiaceae bacterium]|jgi:2-desacetyl-2-hydroxyethyl bacteriochlorophyllide A dehydrogenase|nr:alcohol dehydrogenase catalytic domain-containing protein [Casimicrobiaceae bacterium]